jgi:hypothetical protein
MKKKYLLVKFIGINMIRMHRFKLRHHRTQGVQDRVKRVTAVQD